MTLKSPQNLFPGINPLLNSFLQRDAGEWESFHAELVVQTRIALDEQLPDGYLALAEKSLQIREFAFTEDFDPLTAVVIYQQTPENPLGQPITRLEMLSPANKPHGSHFPRYRQRREETLQSGLCLVEVDYLHETPPVIANMPSYRDGDSNAYPYAIIVSDPHPTFSEGEAYIYGFGVLDPIPTVSIPLADTDQLAFDFGHVYHRVFESLRLCAVVVDYDELPIHPNRYAQSDLQSIEKMLTTIRTKHQ